ncbi:hypothetical protein ACIGD1_34350 [Streptomyces sp. NPDC085612]|uniref:hypothetical protein n=1 Tax=Streptomyces sp. NPDC085612 TaxID=3365732 RepID=UPI0037CF6089
MPYAIGFIGINMEFSKAAWSWTTKAVGGLAIPQHGLLLCDLVRMDRYWVHAVSTDLQEGPPAPRRRASFTGEALLAL